MSLLKETGPRFIEARTSQLHFYIDVPLYVCNGNEFILYKPSGTSLDDMRLKETRHPKKLYIRASDKISGIQEAQRGFNAQLRRQVASNNPDKVKEVLVSIMEETLSEPRSGSLEGVSNTIDILISDFARQTNVIGRLVDMSGKDYSTVLHSINVMALALQFAAYMQYPKPTTKTLGLCALLHDVGKTQIDPSILTAPRRLSKAEFHEIERHTIIGHDILRKCRFESVVSQCALEHHEKLDGSGYPNQKTNICETAQIIGIVDCYEALTNNDRPYRSALSGFAALDQIIQKEVRDGKFSKAIYASFIKSLGHR